MFDPILSLLFTDPSIDDASRPARPKQSHSHVRVGSSCLLSPRCPGSSYIRYASRSGRVPFLVYRVCPNDDVLYTRVASALMKPLTLEEIKTAKRVGAITSEELFGDGLKDSRL